MNDRDAVAREPGAPRFPGGRRWRVWGIVFAGLAIGVAVWMSLGPKTAAEQLERALAAEQEWARAKGALDHARAQRLERDVLERFARVFDGSFPEDTVAEAEAHRRLAKVHADAERIDDSLAWTRKLAQRYPADPGIPADLEAAARLAEAQRPKATTARELWDQLSTAYPADARAPAAAFRAAELSEGEGVSLDTTLERYREVVRRFEGKDEAARARWRSVELLERASRWDEAERLCAELEQAFPAAPWGPKALLRRSELCSSKLSRPEDAVKLLERLIAEHPASDEARIARTRLAKEESSAAEQKIERATGGRFGSGGGGGAGVIYDQSSQWTEAQRALFKRIADQKLDVTNEAIVLELDPTAGTAQVTARLSLVHGGAPRKELAMFLSPLAKVAAVELGGKSVAFAHQEEQLVLMLETELATGAALELAVTYALAEPRPRPEIYQLSLGESGFAMGESGWHPTNAFGDVFDFELAVVAPKALTVVAPGALASRTELDDGRARTVWTSAGAGASTFVLYFAYGIYHQVERKWGAVSLAWLTFAEATDAAAELERVEKILAGYATWFGPYPFTKLTVMEVDLAKPLAGVGPASLVWLNVNTKGGPEIRATVLAHELAHQWWGQRVPVALFGTPGYSQWLSEGLATYAETRWAGMVAKDPAATRKQLDRYRGLYFDISRAVHEQPLSQDLSGGAGYFASIYMKGCWVMHHLRWLIGEDHFDRALVRYGTEYAGKGSTVADFQRLLEEESKVALREFFEDWVGGIGGARFDIVEVSEPTKLTGDPPRLTLAVTIEQRSTKTWVDAAKKDAPPADPAEARAAYRTPFELVFKGAGGLRHVERVTMAKARERREFSLPFDPTSIEIDPDGHWLKVEGAHNRFDR